MNTTTAWSIKEPLHTKRKVVVKLSKCCHFDNYTVVKVVNLSMSISTTFWQLRLSNWQLWVVILTWYQIRVVKVTTFWLSTVTTLTTFRLTTIKLSPWQRFWQLSDNLAFCVYQGLSQSSEQSMPSFAEWSHNEKAVLWVLEQGEQG